MHTRLYARCNSRVKRLHNRSEADRQLNKSVDEWIEMSEKQNGLHALVVEDERICALIMVEVFRMLGISATIAKSAPEALSVLESSRVDLITLDIRIEGDMDGWELAAKIRDSGQCYASVPIVAVTTCCFADDFERSSALGIDRHVAKPFHIDQMKKVITQLLDEPTVVKDL